MRGRWNFHGSWEEFWKMWHTEWAGACVHCELLGIFGWSKRWRLWEKIKSEAMRSRSFQGSYWSRPFQTEAQKARDDQEAAAFVHWHILYNIYLYIHSIFIFRSERGIEDLFLDFAESLSRSDGNTKSRVQRCVEWISFVSKLHVVTSCCRGVSLWGMEFLFMGY